MTIAQPKSPRSRQFVRAGLALTVAALLLSVLAAIAVSPVPMRGAEVFGRIAKKIKGNPGATALVSLSAGAALWVGVAVLTAAQECSAAKRRT